MAGCGAGARQDADEPKGDFPVAIVSASFPSHQTLAATSDMTIVVRNPGQKTIPVVSVTVKCAPPRATGGGAGSSSGTGSASGFGYRSSYPGLADPVRPKFVVNTIPTRTPRNYDRGRLDPLERSSSYVDTFTLGSLAPGRTATFKWNVTAVKAGSYRLCYRVNAGLDFKAKAVPAGAGQRISGQFAGVIQGRPPQAHIAQDGKTVVQGKAVSANHP